MLRAPLNAESTTESWPRAELPALVMLLLLPTVIEAELPALVELSAVELPALVIGT